MTMKKTDRQEPQPRKPYRAPKLVVHGDVRVLTRSGAFSRSEGAPTNKKTTSDRRAKEAIVAIGRHATGVCLYLFRYRPEFRPLMGPATYLGVMADEVETIVPAAVSTDADGYRQVDYAALDAAAGSPRE